MRLEQLRFVQEVYRTKSMSTAANNLFVTPQYISKAIKQLEDEMQVTIFRRSKNGTFPTLKGEKVCEKIEDILQNIDSLNNFDEIKITNLYDSKKISLIVPQTVNYFLQPLYQEYLSEYPETTLNIYLEESLVILLSAEKTYPDMFILGQEKGETIFTANLSPLYDQYVLYEDTFYCWHHENWTPDNFLSKEPSSLKAISMKQLVKMHGIIMYGDLQQKSSTIERLFLKRGQILKSQIKINNVEDCITLAANNHSLCYLESSLLADFFKIKNRPFSLKATPIKEKPIMIYRLFVKKELANDLSIVHFLEKIQKLFSKTFRKI